jgi:hypothetical protein
MEVSGEHHAPAALPPRVKPVAYWTGGWVGLRAGLDVLEKGKISVRYLKFSVQSSILYSGYRVSFPGVKRQGRGVDHPPLSSAEVK